MKKLYNIKTNKYIFYKVIDCNICLEHESVEDMIIFFSINDEHFINMEIDCYANLSKYNCIGIKINTLDQLKFLEQHEIFNNVSDILVDISISNNPEIQYLKFVDKNITVDVNNNSEHDYVKLLFNPLISNICNLPESKFLECEKISKSVNESKQINSMTCHINIGKICNYFNNFDSKAIVLNSIKIVFGYFTSYYIFNLNKTLSNLEIEDIYTTLSKNLGRIVICRPVNDNRINASYSRDIKFIPNTNHFYSSNIMQPLHSDFAYFPYKKAPDYLTLFCYNESEYGGITSLISTEKIKNIMSKYNPELYSKIEVDFKYKSQVDETGNYEIHNKKFFDKNTDYINWNYFQIKEEYNNKEQMELKEEIFKFFNEIISNGYMYDLNIEWKRGDCILFNDQLNLHTRTAFLGERWLSGNSFYA